MTSADIIICGAGIAGLAAAYHLSVRHGRHVILVDERPPLSLTSDKSTEAYRNWWPGPDDAMIRLMNRSIDLLESWDGDGGGRLRLNRRGYVYVTTSPEGVARLQTTADNAAAQGVGPLRRHDGPRAPAYRPHAAESYRRQPGGADLLLHPELIAAHFPYLTRRARAVLHARRCGWFSGQQLGMFLLEEARRHGARLQTGRVVQVDTRGGAVSGVQVQTATGLVALTAPVFVNAAGPLLRPVGRLLGLDLPVFSERHLKAAFKDNLGAVPRTAPLLIYDDPQTLEWQPDERDWLRESAETHYLTHPLPAGVHLRPEGGADSQTILLLWAYDAHPTPEIWPLPANPLFPEVVMRGCAALVPGLRPYSDVLPRPYLDGGYYTKTADNRPLCGPLPLPGAYVLGALSGFGLMATPAAAELLAAHICAAALPTYAPAFHPARFTDPAYTARLAAWGQAGQL